MPNTEGAEEQQQTATTPYTPLGWAAFPPQLSAQAVALGHSMDSVDESLPSTSFDAPAAGNVSPAVIAAFLAQQQQQQQLGQQHPGDDDTDIEDSRASNALASATSGSLDEYIAAEHEQQPHLHHQHTQLQKRMQEEHRRQQRHSQQQHQQQPSSQRHRAEADVPAPAATKAAKGRRRRAWPQWLKNLASAAVAAGLVAGGMAVGIEAFRIHMRHLDDREELISQIESHKRTEEKLLGRCMAAEKARDDARLAAEQAAAAKAAEAAKAKALESEAKATAAERDELGRLNMGLQRKLTEAEARGEKLEGSCAAAKEQVDALKAENGRLNKQVGELERQIERWQVRCGELEGNCEALQKEHAKVEARTAAELKRIKQTLRKGSC